MMNTDGEIERLLRRIEQGIYALYRTPQSVVVEGEGEPRQSTSVVHARVDLPPVLTVAVNTAPPMSLAPSYASEASFVSETVSANGSWTIPVPSEGFWVLNAVYAGGSVELARTIGSHTYIIWESATPSVLHGLNLALSADAPLTVVNSSSSSAPFACELRRLPF